MSVMASTMHRYLQEQMSEQRWEVGRCVIKAADVVFMNSNMDAIPQAIALANKTGAVAMQNVIFAIGIKVIVMILGLTGIYTNMWLAVFADTGVAFLCILNSIRILRQK